MAFKTICCIFVALCVIDVTLARIPRNPRPEESSSSSASATTTTDATTTTTKKPLRFCDRNEPCGWTVYQKNIRKDIDYYLDNACKCPPPKKCELTNDDISIYAYVHRCVPLEPEKSIYEN